jgi:ABC-2 type transport system permease protein
MLLALQRIAAIASKEVRQLARDRLTFAMVIGIPLILILLFGFAINLDVRNLRAGVVDDSSSQAARWLVADAQASQVLDVVRTARTAQELEAAMRRNEIVVGIYIPRDFERRLTDPSLPAAQLLVDGTDPLIAGVAAGLADMPVATRVTPRSPSRSRMASASSTFALRPFFNPEQRSAVMIVPGLIGVILTFTMVLFTAVAIVRERERGNLELLITTPVRTSELMAGKILPYIVIGLIQVTLILGVGVWLFDVPIRGSLLDLYLASAVYIAATLAVGLLISTIAKIQFQAFQLTFFIMMPSILLSGFVFPFDGMPRTAQLIAQALPLTHFIVLIRGIVLKGAELSELLAPLRNLGIVFAVAMTLAMLRFRKRLD